jgi:hypothetical protein
MLSATPIFNNQGQMRAQLKRAPDFREEDLRDRDLRGEELGCAIMENLVAREVRMIALTLMNRIMAGLARYQSKSDSE